MKTYTLTPHFAERMGASQGESLATGLTFEEIVKLVADTTGLDVYVDGGHDGNQLPSIDDSGSTLYLADIDRTFLPLATLDVTEEA